MNPMFSEVDAGTQDLLQRFGFDSERFAEHRERLLAGKAGPDSNILHGNLRPPAVSDVEKLPPVGSNERRELEERGLDALRKGEVGALVLAGGMATRFGGVVKATVPAIDNHTFLDLKLADFRQLAEKSGAAVPAYLMTSFATDPEIGKAAKALSTTQCPVETFSQFISLRMTPEGELFRDAEGKLSPYAPGHGDLSFALRASGALASFREKGGKTLFMSNVDNLSATLDPAIVGAHLRSGQKITVECAPKVPGDKGGAPAFVNDSLEIVEGFRFPADFDQDSIPVFNTNTLMLDAEAIDRDFPLDWFAVTKKVGGKAAIQFEHLVGQLTAFLPSGFIQVEREGDDARFQPVKDPAELERRQPELRAILKARGVL